MTAFNPKSFCRTLTQLPGVYKMLDARGNVIYVGKAANLKKRVSSYFGRNHVSAKTGSMVSQVCGIEVMVTNTEAEALLLENNLIKELKPRYNILFRDDKSYPYIHLSLDHDYPRLSFYRGARKYKGRYFGPYPSAGAARQTLNLAQKIFQARQCDDNFFVTVEISLSDKPYTLATSLTAARARKPLWLAIIAVDCAPYFLKI